MAVVALPVFSLQAILIFILLFFGPLKVSSGLIVQSVMVLPKHNGWWAVLYSSPCAGKLLNKTMAAVMLPLFNWWSIWCNFFYFCGDQKIPYVIFLVVPRSYEDCTSCPECALCIIYVSLWWCNYVDVLLPLQDLQLLCLLKQNNVIFFLRLTVIKELGNVLHMEEHLKLCLWWSNIVHRWYSDSEETFRCCK